MTAEYNAGNVRAELLGDGSGWQRMRGQFPTPPAGAKQAIYVMRVETDLAASYTADTGLVWSAAAYVGLKFDSSFPSSSEAGHSDYDNFFGFAAEDTTSPYDAFNPYYDSSDDAVTLGKQGGGSGGLAYDGNGGLLDASVAIRGDSPWWIGAATASYPDKLTLVWRVYSHPTNNSVLYECWASRNSFDLTTFDIANDMDPDDPKATFPVFTSFYGSSLQSGTIHGDTFGTTWRPNNQVMAFPPYFMAGHPGTAFNLYVRYVGVQYSLSVT